MLQNYSALIIDLKKSRSYTKDARNRIQHYMLSILCLLNGLYRRDIVKEVEFSAGDEMQGLFTCPEAAYLFYRMFSAWLHPVKVRAGIGIGSWDVQIADKGTSTQDGQAYHNARYAIQHADISEGYPLLLYSGEKADITINTIIGSAALMTDKQSIYQNQLMLITEMLFPICNDYLDPYDDGIAQHQCFSFLVEKNYFDHEKSKFFKPLPFDYLTSQVLEMTMPVNAEDAYSENSFFIISGKTRGIPTKLASVLDISRQSIEKTIKAGNIYTVRNMAIAAINEMKFFK